VSNRSLESVGAFAPGMYERAGFKRMAEFKNWPEGHTNVLLCKTLSDHEN
jgi:hypothetical protein